MESDPLFAEVTAQPMSSGGAIHGRGRCQVTQSVAQQRLCCCGGHPVKEMVSTSHVERQNLTMRMGMRRFTRLTNGFSKKLENHLHMLSLYFVHYNFVRTHKSLRMTPAMAAGAADTLHDMTWLAGLVEAAAPKAGPRGPYKKKEISN